MFVKMPSDSFHAKYRIGLSRKGSSGGVECQNTQPRAQNIAISGGSRQSQGTANFKSGLVHVFPSGSELTHNMNAKRQATVEPRKKNMKATVMTDHICE